MPAPSAVGVCPLCGTTIDSHSVLIEYERSEGSGIYAECPGCRDVVTPA